MGILLNTDWIKVRLLPLEKEKKKIPFSRQLFLNFFHHRFQNHINLELFPKGNRGKNKKADSFTPDHRCPVRQLRRFAIHSKNGTFSTINFAL